MVQLSHSFITIGKTIALTRWTFVSKVERSRCRYIGGWVSQVELVVKNLPAKAGDIREVGLIPGSGRSSGVENGNPLRYSCLDNSMTRGAWQAAVHEVTKSQTWLSTHTKQQQQKLILILLNSLTPESETEYHIRLAKSFLWVSISCWRKIQMKFLGSLWMHTDKAISLITSDIKRKD